MFICDSEKVEDIVDILIDCGISKIKEAEFFDELDDGGILYYLDAEVPAPFRIELILCVERER